MRPWLVAVLLLLACPSRRLRLEVVGMQATASDAPLVAIATHASDEPVPGSSGTSLRLPSRVFLFQASARGLSLQTTVVVPPLTLPDGGVAPSGDLSLTGLNQDGSVVLHTTEGRLTLNPDGTLEPASAPPAPTPPTFTFPSVTVRRCRGAESYLRTDAPQVQTAGGWTVLVQQTVVRDWRFNVACSESTIQVARFDAEGRLHGTWSLYWGRPVDAAALGTRIVLRDDGTIIVADARADRPEDKKTFIPVDPHFPYESPTTRLTVIPPSGALLQRELPGIPLHVANAGPSVALLLKRDERVLSRNDVVVLDALGRELGRIGTWEGELMTLQPAPSGVILIQTTRFDEEAIEVLFITDQGRASWWHGANLRALLND